MNRLDPALQRLVRWSRQGPPPHADAGMPPGLAARIAARRNLARTASEFLDLPPLAGWAAWVSGLVIIGGLAILLSHARADLPLEWASGAQFAINQLAP